MEQYEGLKRSGQFKLSSGIALQGELSIHGATTTLELFSDEFFYAQGNHDIVGRFHDRSLVSLLHCIVRSGPGSGSNSDGHGYHFSTIFPHFVVFGDRHIKSSEQVVEEVSFTVDDAHSLFYDFDAFGHVLNSKPHIESLLKAQERRLKRKIPVGEYPEIYYFTGKHELLSVQTVLGRISVSHWVTRPFTGPRGFHVENTPGLHIAFDSPRTPDDAVDAVMHLLRFIEMIAGRPQNVTRLNFLLPEDGKRRRLLNVYWCMPPRRERENEGRRPHPIDMPIQAAMRPRHFTKVLARWLKRQESWRDARFRFSTAFANQDLYTVDRLVGAANMFDILPDPAGAKTIAIDSDLKLARDEARRLFKALPDSQERGSILNALGRIGKPSLTHKVQKRAKLITDAIGDKFPELDRVAREAVLCRNYYVHGTPGAFDYNRNFDAVIFLTNTLEFIFGASDLIEAGWDAHAWTKRGSTMSHPFGTYRINYAQELGELTKLLSGGRASRPNSE